jgi:hypothetical protein
MDARKQLLKQAQMIPALERLQRAEVPYPDGSYADTEGWNARLMAAQR